jgi:hypothetical protein
MCEQHAGSLELSNRQRQSQCRVTFHDLGIRTYTSEKLCRCHWRQRFSQHETEHWQKNGRNFFLANKDYRGPKKITEVNCSPQYRQKFPMFAQSRIEVPDVRMRTNPAGPDTLRAGLHSRLNGDWDYPEKWMREFAGDLGDIRGADRPVGKPSAPPPQTRRKRLANQCQTGGYTCPLAASGQLLVVNRRG